MIYICAENHFLAKPFIEKFKLKKDVHDKRFQIFKNYNTMLIICGQGKIKPAVAVTYMLTLNEPKESDILLSLGYCCSRLSPKEKSERVFLCNHIVDGDSGKQYYPDIILRHFFMEVCIMSISCNGTYKYNSEIDIIDKETAGIFLAASLFMELHQILMLKVDGIDRNSEGLCENQINKIINWIETIECPFPVNTGILPDKIEKDILIIGNNLRWTENMIRQFRQLINYKRIKNESLSQYMDKYLTITCNTKDEGKKIFAELKKEFI